MRGRICALRKSRPSVPARYQVPSQGWPARLLRASRPVQALRLFRPPEQPRLYRRRMRTGKAETSQKVVPSGAEAEDGQPDSKRSGALQPVRSIQPHIPVFFQFTTAPAPTPSL